MTLSTVAIIVCNSFVRPWRGIALLNAIEFRPPAAMPLSPLSPSHPHAPADTPAPQLRLVTWNLGFASLDARMDYFTDGGRRSRGFGRKHTEANLATIIATLRDIDADIIFLQEVDRRSARSHYVDQVAALRSAFPDHIAYFAANLVSPYIPVPLHRPIGRVHSGLMTLGARLPSHRGHRTARRASRTLPLPKTRISRQTVLPRSPDSPAQPGSLTD